MQTISNTELCQEVNCINSSPESNIAGPIDTKYDNARVKSTQAELVMFLPSFPSKKGFELRMSISRWILKISLREYKNGLLIFSSHPESVARFELANNLFFRAISCFLKICQRPTQTRAVYLVSQQ